MPRRPQACPPPIYLRHAVVGSLPEMSLPGVGKRGGVRVDLAREVLRGRLTLPAATKPIALVERAEPVPFLAIAGEEHFEAAAGVDEVELRRGQ